MTAYSDVTIIVVKAELQLQAEQAAVSAEPDGGAGTFVPGSPLRVAGDPSNTVHAFWTQWPMKPGQRSAFATAMGGPMQIIGAGGNVNKNRDRWMFDASEGAWTPSAVLAVLGLDRLLPADI
jgi:hypothetical protein